ncbi:MAG: hypothetical protein HZB40_10995 [Rhodocyclales bacterium]|nr:hypothetical protein [Rhodocyclales bacterium]
MKPGTLSRVVCQAVLLLAMSSSAPAGAASLGEASGRVVLGQPLSLRIPVIGLEAASLAANCIVVQAAPGTATDAGLTSAVARFEHGAVILTSRFPIAQPILSFQIRLDCGLDTTREYHLLPELPRIADESTPQPVPALPLVAPETPRGAQAADSRQTVAQTTTLRLMSRQRYPGNPRARVDFIRRVGAANPGVFASIEAAYDQPLPPGVELHIPPAPARTEPAPARSRPRDDSRGKGRLVIGTDIPATKKLAELESDLERLVGIMNEQVQVQIAMTQRLKAMEADIELAKQAFIEQQATNRRLEEQLRELREEQRRASYIQIVLMILLSGFAVAAVLMWRGRAKASPSLDLAITYRSTPAVQKAPARKDDELQSIFDDLLPPK